MLGENAVEVFGFDRAALRAVADGIGADIAEILTPPEEDLFSRRDVHEPLATASQRAETGAARAVPGSVAGELARVVRDGGITRG